MSLKTTYFINRILGSQKVIGKVLVTVFCQGTKSRIRIPHLTTHCSLTARFLSNTASAASAVFSPSHRPALLLS